MLDEDKLFFFLLPLGLIIFPSCARGRFLFKKKKNLGLQGACRMGMQPSGGVGAPWCS